MRNAGWRVMAMAVLMGCLTTASSVVAAPPAGDRGLGGRATSTAPTATTEDGASIRLWSRFDGVAQKIAWSRFVDGRWTDPRLVTFGPGDDLAPVFGTSSAGSFLYWTDGRGRVLYAPFDPGFGRLFAVPRTLRLAASGRGGPSTEGGTDAPVIIGLCDGTNDPCVQTGHGTPVPFTTPPTNGPSTEGGTDAPVVLSVGGTGGDTGNSGSGDLNETILAAASSPSCGTQVLAVASGNRIHAVAIDGAGRVTPLGRYTLAPGLDPTQAAASVAVYLQGHACN
jgi:hypothetical protein